jgi:hypothetical protein
MQLNSSRKTNFKSRIKSMVLPLSLFVLLIGFQNCEQVSYVPPTSQSSTAPIPAGTGNAASPGTTIAPAATPTTGAPTLPVAVPTPRPAPLDPSAFSITSPANGMNVSGTIAIVAVVGSSWVNASAYVGNWQKVAADVAPTNGKVAISVDTNQLSNGTNIITVAVFTVPAGQQGGTSASIQLTVNVANTPRYTLQARQSGLYLTTPSVTAGSIIEQDTFIAGEQRQQFELTDVGGGLVQLRNVASAMCAAVMSGSAGNYSQIALAPCVATDQSQKFNIVLQVDGYSEIQTQAGLNSTCMDIAGASLDAGAPAIEWTCHGGDNQRFLVSPK